LSLTRIPKFRCKFSRTIQIHLRSRVGRILFNLVKSSVSMELFLLLQDHLRRTNKFQPCTVLPDLTVCVSDKSQDIVKMRASSKMLQFCCL
jgi:hypothetical protein